jgi:hypothetical protein
VALCQARISTKPLWGFSSSNPYHSQSRAEHLLTGKMSVPEQGSSAILQVFLLASFWIPNLFCFKGGRSPKTKSQNLRTLFLSLANAVICRFVICGPKFLDELRICG